MSIVVFNSNAYHMLCFLFPTPDFDRETLIKTCHFFDSIVTLKRRGSGGKEGERGKRESYPKKGKQVASCRGAHIHGRCAATVSYKLVLR